MDADRQDPLPDHFEDEGEPFDDDDFDEVQLWGPGPRPPRRGPLSPEERSLRRFGSVVDEAEDVRARLAAADAEEGRTGQSAATLAVGVGLALRHHRGALGLGQRAFAERRGWSKSRAARLEVGATGMRLATVVASLEGTGCGLALVREAPDGSLAVVDTNAWSDLDLAARDGAERLLPAAATLLPLGTYREYHHSERYGWGRKGPRWTWERRRPRAPDPPAPAR